MATTIDGAERPARRNAASAALASTQSLTAGSVTAISPATQPSSAPPIVMMIGQRSMNFMSSVLPKITSGMLMSRPRISSVRLPFAAAATAITLSRLITRSAMRIVRIAATMPVLALAPRAAAFLLVLRQQQLDADPQQQRRADELEVGQRQQLDRDDRQHDPHDDRGAAAPQDGLLLLLGRQRARRERDHHRVVAGQDDVDADDLQQRDPEFGS